MCMMNLNYVASVSPRLQSLTPTVARSPATGSQTHLHTILRCVPILMIRIECVSAGNGSNLHSSLLLPCHQSAREYRRKTRTLDSCSWCQDERHRSGHGQLEGNASNLGQRTTIAWSRQPCFQTQRSGNLRLPPAPSPHSFQNPTHSSQHS